MRKTGKASLALSLGAILAVGSIKAVGVAAPAAPAAPPAPPAPAAGPATAPTTAPAAVPFARDLAAPFESVSGGVLFRPPVGMKALFDPSKEQIVEFIEDPNATKQAGGGGPAAPASPAGFDTLPTVRPAAADPNDDQKPRWSLVVGRQAMLKPEALTAGPDELGRIQPGVLQKTVDEIKRQNPGCEVLRQNLTNLGDHDVAMIVYRFTKNARRYLAQRAIVEANDQLFYWLALTTPGRPTDAKEAAAEPQVDPDEREAVATFRAVLESVKLLDRNAIYEDDQQRLFRTRTLFYNLTEKKVTSVMIPEQWRRVVAETPAGPVDIGYQYIEEKIDAKSHPDGVTIGVRTRITDGGRAKPFPRVDSEQLAFVAFDRHHEEWSNQSVIDPDGKPKTAVNPWKRFIEFGSSDLKTTRILIADPKDVTALAKHPEDRYKMGEVGDKRQPWVQEKEDYKLNVQFRLSYGELDPVDRPLPPWYLPQGLSLMLPRLVPPTEIKGYLMAGYVGGVREVMKRYVDVGPERLVKLNGVEVRAVPISEHFGLQGPVTTHYVDRKGNWYGTTSAATKVTILPTDKATLAQIWGTDDLFHLDDLDEPARSPAAGTGPNPAGRQGPVGGGVPRRIGPGDRPTDRPTRGAPSPLDNPVRGGAGR